METKFIVVPIDFTPATTNALKYAVSLASDIGQEVLALHILADKKERIEKEIGPGQIGVLLEEQ